MIRSWKNIKPKIHPTAFISEAAYVLGEVEIGSNSSIWPGVVIRGDSGKIKIGNNTNIQDGSIVHSDAPAVIGDNVTIGHGVVCHARIIGNDCLIGNNATVNDGAERPASASVVVTYQGDIRAGKRPSQGEVERPGAGKYESGLGGL